MTEAEWLACTDPRRMLFYLFCNCNHPAVRAYYSGEVGLIEPDGRHLGVSERKPRLFYCACCRRALPLAPESDIAGPVEVGERLADGLSPDGEWVRPDSPPGPPSNAAAPRGARSIPGSPSP